MTTINLGLETLKKPQSSIQVIRYGIRLWYKTLKWTIYPSLLNAVITVSYSFYFELLTAHSQKYPDSKLFLPLLRGDTFWLFFCTLSIIACMSILPIIACMLLETCIVYQMHSAKTQNYMPSLKHSLKVAFRRIPAIIGVWVLLALLPILIGLFLLFLIWPMIGVSEFTGIMLLLISLAVISIIFWYVCAGLATYIVMIKNLGSMHCIRKSLDLVSGSFWHRTLVLIFIILMACFIQSFLIFMIDSKGISFIMNIFLISLCYPLVQACSLSLLYDLETRAKLNQQIIIEDY